HWGRAMQAVRENELAAEVIGVPTFRTKVLAFVISAALGGLGGALYAVGSMYISPDTFDFGQSVTHLTMVLLGGAQWVIGSVVGGHCRAGRPSGGRAPASVFRLPPSASSADRGRRQALRRRARRRRGRSTSAGRRNTRADWPQRLGQEHPPQPAQRHLHAEQW